MRQLVWACLAAMLPGLACADANADARVSANELASYLDREVPALARKNGHEQTPTFRADTDGVVYLSQ